MISAAPIKPATADLLTLDDIAAMHHCSQRHARDIIVKLPGFPAEAPTSTPRHRFGGRMSTEGRTTTVAQDAAAFCMDEAASLLRHANNLLSLPKN